MLRHGGAPSALEARVELDPKTCRRVIRDAHKYLEDYQPTFDLVVDGRQPVAHMLWGWGRWLAEQSIFVLRGSDKRTSLALEPLVRSVGEHADLMLWLSEVGPDGIQALHVAKQRHQQQLFDAYVRANGHPPEGGVERVPDTYTLKSPEQLAAFQEFENIETRASSFPTGVPYYVYRALSDLVHAGISTSRAFAPVDESGTGLVVKRPQRPDDHGWPEAALADCAVRACQAGLVLVRELREPPLEQQVQGWCARLGIADVLPDRVVHKPKQYTRSDLANIADHAMEAGSGALAAIESYRTDPDSVPDRNAAVSALKAFTRQAKKLAGGAKI